MTSELAGKVAVVTGAAQGIGRAFALGLARAGCRVAAADLNGDLASQTAELARAAGGDALGMSVDVASRAAVTGLIEAVVARWGGLDIQINNAGTFPRSTVLEMDDAVWDEVIDTNLKGTFLCSQVAARQMVAQGRGGRIVSVSSRAAYGPSPRGAHYSASKAGIIAFTRALALELAPYQITVNALAPGLTNTAQPRYGMTEQEIAEQSRLVPLGRMAEPEDMVPIVLFLCAQTGAYITGQVMHVNGGSLMP